MAKVTEERLEAAKETIRRLSVEKAIPREAESELSGVLRDAERLARRAEKALHDLQAIAVHAKEYEGEPMKYPKIAGLYDAATPTIIRTLEYGLRGREQEDDHGN